ncbi:MAG: alpha/beta hydrolase [Selenomonadaceae bacterium]|nr:alpha/beta hydrolase [Selenomonadaceae bacterium]
MKRKLAATLSASIIFLSGLNASAATTDRSWNLDEMINPELRDDFSKREPIDFTDFKERRRALAIAQSSLPTDDRVTVNDVMLIGAGVPDLRVRIYRPTIKLKEYPALLWTHGGGHIMGSPELYEGLLLKMASELDCIIVAPDYRLAPENPYPADLDDCYAALKWMTDRKKSRLPIDKTRVAVAGDSAGGGLAVAVAMRARDDKKGPAICFDMPLYPQLDYTDSTDSSYQITDHRVWNRDANQFAWRAYLNNRLTNVEEYASPAHAKNLAGMPPTYIMIGTLDMFRDEAIDYAQRLMDAGVPVELHVIPGLTHAFNTVVPDNPLSVRLTDEFIAALKQALNAQVSSK